MNLKKFAVRGMVFLAVFVALCLFFSGTVRTITTPKVRLTSARRGKLEERVELSCKVAFPVVEEVRPELEDDLTITITRVNTREGYTVEAGEVVIEARVTNFETLRRQYQDNYDSATEELMSLENRNRNIRVSRRDEEYAEAYFALRDARRATLTAQMTMEALLSRENLTLPESGYPEGASEALTQAIDAWRQAAAAEQTAQQAMDRAGRYMPDEDTWNYITGKREAEQKLSDAEGALRRLMALSDEVAAIAAPHDGYIAELPFKEGETYDGTRPLFTLTPEGELPVLRGEITDDSHVVTEGQTAAYKPDSYDPVESEVVAVGTDADGKKYCDIKLTKALIKSAGSVFALSQTETPMSLIYRSRETSTLVPAAAVSGSGDKRKVMVVDGPVAETMVVRAMEVNVLGEYNGQVSVQEDLSYYTIAYGSDRPIQDGDTVMQYVN